MLQRNVAWVLLTNCELGIKFSKLNPSRHGNKWLVRFTCRVDPGGVWRMLDGVVQVRPILVPVPTFVLDDHTVG